VTYLFSQVRAFWDPGVGARGCLVHAPRMHLISMSIATIGTYAVLLIAMLTGLLRQRPERSFGVWDMLCQQVRVHQWQHSRGLTSVLARLGMDMVCIGSGGRGAYSGKCCPIDDCLLSLIQPKFLVLLNIDCKRQS